MVRILTTLLAFAGLFIVDAARAATEVPDGQMPALAIPSAALYRCATVVTGTRVETRLPGFVECLSVALVKLSGDRSILKDKRFARAAKRAGDYVARFSYHDRFAGRPLHDEQGTHDRPHDLTVEFDAAKLDALTRSLGREPWPLPRPHLMMLLAVENLRKSFVLTSDGSVDRSIGMREAIAAAAEKAGLPAIVLPTQATVAARAWTAKTLPHLNLIQAEKLARVTGGDAAIVGHIVFSEKALGWIVRWRMKHGHRNYTWGTRGVNFDAAFRNALFGAAHVLAGLGAPN
jgi:uncharacterized protein